MNSSKFWLAVLAAASCSLFGNAHADVTEADGYMQRLKIFQTVQPHGDTPLGEQLNLYTGELSFRQADIVVEGTGPSISLVRSTVGSQTEGFQRPGSIGNWHLSIPRLETLTTAPLPALPLGSPGNNWTVANSTDPNRYLRCTHFNRPFPKQPMVTEWWTGLDMTTEDGNRQQILRRSAQNTQQPAMTLNGQPVAFPAVTQQNWQIGCLPATSNGETGEAFLAVSPDGTKYWFDRLHGERVETFYEEDSVSGFILKQPRMFATMYVTRIEDRFGNSLTYSYAGDKLASITGSDGRVVTLQWRADSPVVDTITVQPGPQQRVWQYQYSVHTPTQAILSAVVLPDASRWTFDFLGGGLGGAPTSLELSKCTTRSLPNGAEVLVATVTHPSGLVGRFWAAPTWHGRNYNPSFCQYAPIGQEYDPYEKNPPLFGTASLTRKEFSGPGIPVQAWVYQWPVAVGTTTSDPCAASQSCPTTTSVDVIDPEGDRTHYTYSNRFDHTETKLLQVDTYQGASTLLRSETTAYAPANNGPYPAFLGYPMIGAEYNPDKDSAWTPTQVRTIVQQGTTFTWQANSFDLFANPLSTTRSSTLGYTRTDASTYFHDTAKWVIGQSASSTNTNTGLIESQTDYWPGTALPQRTWSFGKPQQYFVYNANGTLATITDGNNRTTSFANWKRGIPQTMTFADNTFKSAVVNDLGGIDSVTDENGYTTKYGYDAMGRVNLIDYPDGDDVNWNNTTITFAPAGATGYGLPAGHWRRTESTGAARKITYFDAFWRPMLQEVYDSGNTWNTMTQSITRYDADGLATFTSYPQRSADPAVYGTWANPSVAPNASGTWSSYDALGRPTLVQQTSELGLLNTSYEYLAGFLTRNTNPRGFQTVTQYQTFDQPSTASPSGITAYAGADTAVTEIARDLFGKPNRLKRRNELDTVSSSRYYVYDGYQQLCKTIEPETGATAMGYDAAGNLSWSAAGLALPSTTSCDVADVPGNLKVNRTYDVRNRIFTLAFPGGRGNQLWGYTPDGLISQTRVFNGPNQTEEIATAYHYNRRRLLNGEGETVTQPNWYTWGIGYGYDNNGNVAVQSYPTGQTVRYWPNALGQATLVTSEGMTFAAGMSYYPNGALQQFTYGNNIVHSMVQNARQLPQTSTDSGGVLNHQYGYDAHGNVNGIIDLNRGDGFSRWMSYDALDRLKTAGSCSFGPGCSFTYDYDPRDNLTRVQGPNSSDRYYCYDARNLLTNLKDGPCASGATVTGLGYDDRGNVSNKNGQLYDFDFGNRLRGVTGVEGYRYDGFGRRVQTTHADQSMRVWQYSQSGQLMFGFSETAAQIQSTQQYLYLAGSLLAIVDRNWPSQAINSIKFQHTDALGTPVAETDTAGTVVQRSEYDPYGRLNNRPLTDGLGYTGHYQDAATGLTYMQQRYYDSQIGRFLSRDPVTANANTGANFNAYWYANNNPYRFNDPDGRVSDDPRRQPGREQKPPPPPPPPPCSAQCMRMRSASDRGQSGTPRTPFSNRGDLISGFAKGAWSIAVGNGRAVRQVGRSGGALGRAEHEDFIREGEFADGVLHELSTNPQARELLYKGLKQAAMNAPYSDPNFQGYVLGRVGTGMLLAPLGVSATIGDGMHHVENGATAYDDIVIKAMYGK